MKRRGFLSAGATGLSLGLVAGGTRAAPSAAPPPADPVRLSRLAGTWPPFDAAAVEGHEPGPPFRFEGADWRVYQDRRRRDGATTFVSPDGRMIRLSQRLEPCAVGPTPPYLGLPMKTVATSGPDLLADGLLAHGGDPDPEAVRTVAPPLGSLLDDDGIMVGHAWTFFVGTVQAGDTMPITPGGSTRSLHVDQLGPGPDRRQVASRSEALLGGFLPVLVKLVPLGPGRDWELTVFADTANTHRFVVETFERVCIIEHGAVVHTAYAGSFPAYNGLRPPPDAARFHQALLGAVLSWQHQLADMAPLTLPDPSWADMVRHAFVKELMAKPDGWYPRYGAVERDYAGSEYDGFQDTITSGLLANLEWGRFAQAQAILANALSEFTDDDGVPFMRGPELGQTGLQLSLYARYLRLTGDAGTLQRHRDRIRAMAATLTTLQDRALALPAADPGHGLIAGWSESDSCLFPDPGIWWKPYFNNTAMAARGLRDLAAVWTGIDPSGGAAAADWSARADRLSARLADSLRASIRHDLQPPYVPIMPGTHQTFREAMSGPEPGPGQRPMPSEQQWPHRVYAELLQAGVLPPDLERLTIDSMRGHGATSIGVVGNLGRPSQDSRDLLGFVSYGYAEALLRQERIEEYLLFLYAHRHHVHTPGSWTAGEVTGLAGDMPTFCIPAQMTIPILVRWMLVYEERDTLHLARALPTDWIAGTAGIAVGPIRTAWGPVTLAMTPDPAQREVRILATLPKDAPQDVRISVRVPRGTTLRIIEADGAPAALMAGRRDVIQLGARTAQTVSLRVAIVAPPPH